MTSNAGCWRRQLAVLVIATSLLTGCATVGTELPVATACLTVVEYSLEFQARAADEVMRLQEPSAVTEMLSDYAVMRDQARACHTPSR